jgi:hypothetical protein
LLDEKRLSAITPGSREWISRTIAMRNGVLVFAVAVLTACSAIDPQPRRGPNGRDALYMECSGLGRTLEACYQRAGVLCPKGYDLVERQAGTIAVPTRPGADAGPRESVVIECK